MKTRLTVYFCLSILLGLFTVSCDKNEDSYRNDNGKLLQLSAYIGTKTKSASSKTDWVRNDELGVFVLQSGAGFTAPYHDEATNLNSLFKFDGSEWKHVVKVALDNQDADVYAYYPYDETKTNGAAIPVESTNQIDYLWGKGDKKASVFNTDVSLNMQHALTQVVFKMKQKGYTKGEGHLTRIEFLNNNSSVLRTDGTLNLATGAVTGVTVGGLELAADHVIGSSESLFAAILLPISATSGEDIKVMFTIDGNEYYHVFPAATSWTPGYRNIYTFTLKDNNLILGGEYGDVTIEPWIDSDKGIVQLIPVI